MSAVAIITARGGSKRIPRKNIRPFHGVPIIAYSIQAAREANCFDEVMVSTDDPEIAAVAQRFGAAVPFYRSPEASNDHATTAEAILEVLVEYRRRDRTFALGCCLYPAAPFVTAEALRSGYRLLLDTPELDTVVPVVRFGYAIQRALKIDSGRLSMIWPESRDKRSQDLMPAYHDAGQFYWFRVERFLRHRQLFAPNTAPVILPEWSVHDIDNEDDWMLAETKYDLVQRLATLDRQRTLLP